MEVAWCRISLPPPQLGILTASLLLQAAMIPLRRASGCALSSPMDLAGLLIMGPTALWLAIGGLFQWRH